MSLAVDIADVSDLAPDTGRSRLALAIARWQACSKRVDELEQAQSVAMDRRITARHQRDEAADALVRAREHETHHLVDALVAGDIKPDDAIAQAEDRLEKAEAHYQLACRGADALEQATDQARRDLRWSAVRRQEEIAAVVVADPAVARLLNDHRTALRALQSVESVLSLLAAPKCTSCAWAGRVRHRASQ
jgi:hypothetical protein